MEQAPPVLSRQPTKTSEQEGDTRAAGARSRGAAGRGTARRLLTAQASGCPVAAIEALDQFLPSRRQLLSLVQKVLPPGGIRPLPPYSLVARWPGLRHKTVLANAA